MKQSGLVSFLLGLLTSLVFAVSIHAAAPPPGASVLPVNNGGFDIGGNPFANNWVDPVPSDPNGNPSYFNPGQGPDPRVLSTPNMMGMTSGAFSGTGAAQYLATDHNNVAGTQMRYEGLGIYSLSVHAFSSTINPDSTFKLQLLANPSPATRLGSTVAAEQVFTAIVSTNSSGGVLAPDGVTYWHEATLTFAASNSPSLWGQYMLIQIVGTDGDYDAGHVGGFPNADNVSGWSIPEPSAAVLLLAGAVLLWRRRRDR